MTPPMASEPYRLERGPRTISMRSTWSTGICAHGASPAPTDPMRTPSTSTNVCAELVPRKNNDVCWPRPPELARLTPGKPDNTSSNDCGCSRSISPRVTTVTAARVSLAGCAVRVAVTTTGPSDDACKGAGAAARAWEEIAATSAAQSNLYRMDMSSPRTPRARPQRKDRPHGGHARDTPTAHQARHRPPRSHPRHTTRTHAFSSRPVSGLADRRINVPDRQPSQHHAPVAIKVDPCKPSLQSAYRCGGSAGLAQARTGFPFHRRRKPATPEADASIADNADPRLNAVRGSNLPLPAPDDPA